jgi:hypothetical protein
VRLEEPQVDTFSLESSSKEAVENDFAEEMIKYQKTKLSPVPNLNLRRDGFVGRNIDG